MNYAPLKGVQGEITGAVTSFIDITERKRAEEEARAAAERFRFMAESMPQKVFTARQDGSVDYFNQRWMEFTGLSFEQMRDWGWTQIVHPDDLAETVRRWRASIDTGQPFELENRFRRADGVYRWHLSRVRAVRDAEGRRTMWVGSNTDIDDAKQTEQALAARVEQRTAAIRQLSSKLLRLQDEERRRISRELHDSVGQLLSYAKMSLASLRRPGAAAKETGALIEAADVLDKCLAETRTISYLLHPPLLDEMGFASAAKWFTKGFSERSGIQVGLNLPPELERLPGGLELVLFRVLQESLTNVHRHAKSPSVDIQVALDAGEVALEVRDYGKGMAPELLERFRARREGAGIGLNSIRERIIEVGGKFEIQSGEGGTLIRVGIPLTGVSAITPKAGENPADD